MSFGHQIGNRAVPISRVIQEPAIRHVNNARIVIGGIDRPVIACKGAVGNGQMRSSDIKAAVIVSAEAAINDVDYRGSIIEILNDAGRGIVVCERAAGKLERMRPVSAALIDDAAQALVPLRISVPAFLIPAAETRRPFPSVTTMFSGA